MPKRTKRTIIKAASVPASIDSLIERISDGEFLRDIAEELKIDKRRLSELLRTDPRYEGAKASSIENQLEEAQRGIKVAPTMTDISRAREMFRAASWRAEREFPARWGAKQTVTVISGRDFAEQLRRAQERVIDAEVVNAALLPAPDDSNSSQ